MSFFDRFSFRQKRGFSGRVDTRKLLFIGATGEIAQSQYYPFFHYRKDLLDRFKIEVRETAALDTHKDADIVCFQSWFDLTPEQMTDLAFTVKRNHPRAWLAYFDWFAPTDLRYAEALAPHVKFYVKKQILSDFSQYNRPTLGDTNLSDYYSRKYKINDVEKRFVIPDQFEKQLILSPNFDMSSQVLELLKSPVHPGGRGIDIHARFTAKGTPWYSAMREEAVTAVTRLTCTYQTARAGFVSKKDFVAELRRSKICLSPFGYGEICWRDFEAMATGALLFKPDVSHIKLAAEYFIPYETYIPLKWDLSDLSEKVRQYIPDEAERYRIATNAHNSLVKNSSKEAFLSSEMLRRLN
jgi:hypothetical protein